MNLDCRPLKISSECETSFGEGQAPCQNVFGRHFLDFLLERPEKLILVQSEDAAQKVVKL